MTAGGFRRRLTVAVLGLVMVAMFAAAPPAAAQDDGLRLTAHTVYRVLGDEGAIAVEITYSATNTVPDRRQGNGIVQTYFSSIFEAIPKDAVDIVARRSDGTALSMTPATLTPEQQEQFADSPFNTWQVDLGSNLFFQQTRDFTVTFRVPDGGHRNLDAWARVNPALASFPVVARGDAGRSSVRVEFPPGYEVETFGEPVQRTEAFGATVLTAAEIDRPQDWFVIAVASSDFGLDRRSVDVPGIEGQVTIASWPGDDEWEAFVERGLREGLPVLEETIGVPWPVEDGLEIREAIAPALAGYGGWYYEPPETAEDDAAIVVGEELLMDLLGHEIAHAWFNDDFSRDRWLTEGLAEYHGLLMAEALAPGDAEPFDRVTRRGPGNVELLDWHEPSPFADAEETEVDERWGYAASYQVIDAIAEEIGPDGFTATLVNLFATANPYAPERDDPGPRRVDWRDALDAFELVGGSEHAEALFVEWVLREGDTRELELRDDAQDAVARLGTVAPGWTTPGLVWDLLADWQFDDTIALTEELAAVQADARALLDDAAARGIAVPDGPRRDYESIATLDGDAAAVGEAIADQHDALRRVLGAYERAEEPTGIREDLGLWGADVDALVEKARTAFDAGAYTAAVSAADEVDSTLDDAEAVGTFRALVGGGVVLGLVALLAVLVVRRRRGSPHPRRSFAASSRRDMG